MWNTPCIELEVRVLPFRSNGGPEYVQFYDIHGINCCRASYLWTLRVACPSRSIID